jgi:hypothetical protein
VKRLGYELDDRRLRVRFQAGTRDFSHLNKVQPDSYKMGMGGGGGGTVSLGKEQSLGAQVKNGGAIFHSPLSSSRGA